MMPSAIEFKIIQHDVAPASSTPRERSPRRLERPNLATISFVESRPLSAAAFIFSNASLKDIPELIPSFKASTDGESVSTRVCPLLWHPRFHKVLQVPLQAFLQNLLVRYSPDLHLLLPYPSELFHK